MLVRICQFYVKLKAEHESQARFHGFKFTLFSTKTGRNYEF